MTSFWETVERFNLRNDKKNLGVFDWTFSFLKNKKEKWSKTNETYYVSSAFGPTINLEKEVNTFVPTCSGCDECEYAFSIFGDLKNHRGTHTCLHKDLVLRCGWGCAARGWSRGSSCPRRRSPGPRTAPGSDSSPLAPEIQNRLCWRSSCMNTPQ